MVVPIKNLQQKTFLLGIGAQKAGTTWLYDYLNQHPNTDMGFTKEYHIFDALYIDEQDIKKYFLQQRINNVTHAESKPNLEDITLLQFLENTDTYFEYFKKNTAQQDILLTGDMTPSYSGLTKDGFMAIKQGIRNQGLTIKVIFLMRDPVERCISAARMGLRDSGTKRTVKTEVDCIQRNFTSTGFQMRTQYDHTIHKLEQVFEPTEICYAFYEEFFTQSSIKQICDFLSIPLTRPDFNRRPNESRTDNEIPPDLKLNIARFYKPTYDFICNRFGHERMNLLWPNATLIKS